MDFLLLLVIIVEFLNISHIICVQENKYITKNDNLKNRSNNINTQYVPFQIPLKEPIYIENTEINNYSKENPIINIKNRRNEEKIQNSLMETNSIISKKYFTMSEIQINSCKPKLKEFPGNYYPNGRYIYDLEAHSWIWEYGRWLKYPNKGCQFVKGQWIFKID